MGHSAEYCRCCGALKLCDDWTLRAMDIVLRDEADQDAESLTGLCDECLEAHPDEDCEMPEEPDEIQAWAEREYRNWDRGEL